MLYCQVLTLNLLYYNASTLAFKSYESCTSVMLYCGTVLSGSGVSESITEAGAERCVVFRTRSDRLVRE